MKQPKNTVERVNREFFKTKEKYLLYLRHVFAYEYAARLVQPDWRVLEIGFGSAYGTNIISIRAARVDALDVDQETVELARSRYQTESCRFHWYDGRKLPFEEGTFNMVVAMQVIEHVEDDGHFVAESHRVLGSGGLFVLTTPNRTYRVAPGQKIWNKYHVREYYPEELEQVLLRSFSDVRMRGIRGDEESQQIEIERVRRDFSLRKLVPDFIRKTFDKRALQGYGTNNFHVISDNLEQSLDLLGICSK